jgi:hypothetical protein
MTTDPAGQLVTAFRSPGVLERVFTVPFGSAAACGRRRTGDRPARRLPGPQRDAAGARVGRQHGVNRMASAAVYVVVSGP